ncbi:DNA-dependent ATPase fun30 [Dimargaris xerosporica]|nr:DNA-dependent ATPase fun30 [Dimargaris xerosporica]
MASPVSIPTTPDADLATFDPELDTDWAMHISAMGSAQTPDECVVFNSPPSIDKVKLEPVSPTLAAPPRPMVAASSAVLLHESPEKPSWPTAQSSALNQRGGRNNLGTGPPQRPLSLSKTNTTLDRFFKPKAEPRTAQPMSPAKNVVGFGLPMPVSSPYYYSPLTEGEQQLQMLNSYTDRAPLVENGQRLQTLHSYAFRPIIPRPMPTTSQSMTNRPVKRRIVCHSSDEDSEKPPPAKAHTVLLPESGPTSPCGPTGPQLPMDPTSTSSARDLFDSLNKRFRFNGPLVAAAAPRTTRPKPPPTNPRSQSRQLPTPATLSDADSDDDSDDGPDIDWRSETDVLQFFNTATIDELHISANCTTEAAKLIVTKLRPFGDMAHMHSVFRRNSQLSVASINYYKTVSRGYQIVDRIIQNCQKTATKLSKVFGNLTGVEHPTGPPATGSQTPLPTPPPTMVSQSSGPVEKDSMETADWLLQSQPAIVNPDFRLKNYQLFGISWMNMLYHLKQSGILGDEMGLGKTAQVIGLLAHLLEQGVQGPHLIIVPAATLSNWKREFETICPQLRVTAYYGNLNERMAFRIDWKQLRQQARHAAAHGTVPSGAKPRRGRGSGHQNDDSDLEDSDGVHPEFEESGNESEAERERMTEFPHVVLTTYNMATSSKADRAFVRKIRWETMVVDEAHMLRNCWSLRYQHLMAIPAPFRLLLTGTPLQNNLQELMTLLSFILPKQFEDKGQILQKVFATPTTTAAASKKKTEAKKRASKQSAQADKADDPLPVNSTTDREPVAVLDRLIAERIERAKKLLNPFLLRRRKCQVLQDFPAKHVDVEKVELTANQREFYDRVAQALIEDYKGDLAAKIQRHVFGCSTETPETDSPPVSNGASPLALALSDNESTTDDASSELPQSKSLLSAHMQLRKIALHPLMERCRYTDKLLKHMSVAILKEPKYADCDKDCVFEDMQVMCDYELHQLCNDNRALKSYALQMDQVLLDSGKIQRLETQLATCQRQGDRVLVFSQFTSMLDILEDVLSHWGYRFLRADGSTDSAGRQDLIDEFNNDESILVFLLSTKAAGVGINLASANVVILYDIDYNPHNDKQAEDRAYRVGQKRDVYVYKYIAQNTIEEYILQRARHKLQLDEHISNKSE